MTEIFLLLHIHKVMPTNQHVRGRQGGDEIITGLPDIPVHHEGEQDENVAANRQNDANPQGDGDQDGLWTER